MVYVADPITIDQTDNEVLLAHCWLHATKILTEDPHWVFQGFQQHNIVGATVLANEQLNLNFMAELEKKLVNESDYKFKRDIFQVLEMCQGNRFFTHEFFQVMFEKIMQLVRVEGITPAELVNMKELLQGSVELEQCQEYFDREFIERLAQDINMVTC
jgi:hypothetical protein